MKPDLKSAPEALPEPPEPPEPQKIANSGRFQKGHVPTAHRKKGSKNKTPRALAKLMIDAAAAIGANHNGKDGAAGFVELIGRTKPEALFHALSKLARPEDAGPDPEVRGGVVNTINVISVKPNHSTFYIFGFAIDIPREMLPQLRAALPSEAFTPMPDPDLSPDENTARPFLRVVDVDAEPVVAQAEEPLEDMVKLFLPPEPEPPPPAAPAKRSSGALPVRVPLGPRREWDIATGVWRNLPAEEGYDPAVHERKSKRHNDPWI